MRPPRWRVSATPPRTPPAAAVAPAAARVAADDDVGAGGAGGFGADGDAPGGGDEPVSLTDQLLAKRLHPTAASTPAVKRLTDGQKSLDGDAYVVTYNAKEAIMYAHLASAGRSQTTPTLDLSPSVPLPDRVAAVRTALKHDAAAAGSQLQ